MDKDILERLRKAAKDLVETDGVGDIGVLEAARIEIERLQPYVEAFRREEARADVLGRDLDDLRAERAWQPIETAPRDGTEVDLWCRGQGFSARPGRTPDCWYSNGVWYRHDEDGDDQCRSRVHNITHWMSPPEPPGHDSAVAVGEP